MDEQRRTEFAPEVAKVDFLVDENGSRIEVPEDSAVRRTADAEQAVGATGPATWWRTGLVVLGAIALLLLVMQLFGGGARTDMVPGTPVVQSEPVPSPNP